MPQAEWSKKFLIEAEKVKNENASSDVGEHRLGRLLQIDGRAELRQEPACWRLKVESKFKNLAF